MKSIFQSFKRIFLPFIFLLLTICLVIFSDSNLVAAKNGLILWANNVVPSLFPFFVATELLSNTNLIFHISKFFNKIMRPLFNVPGECIYAFIMGLISGYPTGGKIVADLREQGVCTKDEGERMLTFTNNSGPLFIISCVGISLFGSIQIGFLLLVTHVLAAITVGIILGKFSIKSTKYIQIPNSFSNLSLSRDASVSLHPNFQPNSVTFKDLGKILGKSIKNSISTILIIGGFVVIFSVIISILQNSHLLNYASIFIKPILSIFGFNPDFAIPILSGIVELTNGINMVANISINSTTQNVILCAFLLGFGGLSVLFQVFSLLAKTDLSIKKYIIGKLLQGFIAAFYTTLAFNFFPMLSLDIIPTFAPITQMLIFPINF